MVLKNILDLGDGFLAGPSCCFANLTAVLRDFAEKFNNPVKAQKLKRGKFDPNVSYKI